MVSVCSCRKTATIPPRCVQFTRWQRRSDCLAVKAIASDAAAASYFNISKGHGSLAHDSSTPLRQQEDSCVNLYSFLAQCFEKRETRPLWGPPGDVLDATVSLSIDLDVRRTFTGIPYFQEGSRGQVSLGRLLRVYACFDPVIGYVQGMNFLAAVLLFHSVSEEDAFWLFVAMFFRYELRQLFMPGLPGLKHRCGAVQALLAHHTPRVLSLLSDAGITIIMLTSDWILTLFAYTIPLDALSYLWTQFFYEGWSAIYRLIVYHLGRLLPALEIRRDSLSVSTLPVADLKLPAVASFDHPSASAALPSVQIAHHSSAQLTNHSTDRTADSPTFSCENRPTTSSSPYSCTSCADASTTASTTEEFCHVSVLTQALDGRYTSAMDYDRFIEVVSICKSPLFLPYRLPVLYAKPRPASPSISSHNGSSEQTRYCTTEVEGPLFHASVFGNPPRRSSLLKSGRSLRCESAPPFFNATERHLFRENPTLSFVIPPMSDIRHCQRMSYSKKRSSLRRQASDSLCRHSTVAHSYERSSPLTAEPPQSALDPGVENSFCYSNFQSMQNGSISSEDLNYWWTQTIELAKRRVIFNTSMIHYLNSASFKAPYYAEESPATTEPLPNEVDTSEKREPSHQSFESIKVEEDTRCCVSLPYDCKCSKVQEACQAARSALLQAYVKTSTNNDHSMMTTVFVDAATSTMKSLINGLKLFFPFKLSSDVH